MAFLSKESGFMTIFVGFVVFILGAVFLFDKALIIAGNLLLIAGILIVAQTNVSSFLKIDRLQGTLMFAMGVGFMIGKYTLLGFLLEIGGLIQIFRKTLPNFRTVISNFIFGRALIDKSGKKNE